MIVRPADAADLPAIARISEANDEPVADPDRPGSRYLEHLLRARPAAGRRARRRVVGFAGAIELPTGAS